MLTRTDEIGFEHKGIGDVLAHNRLAVPPNQREYSWEQEHVRDLFTDFSRAIAESRGAYFLGTIVLTRGPREIPEVSDGQQRLATTSILLAAIRDYFHWNSDQIRASSIENDYLMTTDIDTTERTPKLRLNVDDHEFFRRAILLAPDDPGRKIEPSRESHKRIKDAANLAREHVRGVLAPYSDPDKTRRLLEWVRFIKASAQVIVLRVPDYLNAFEMFETLNDRGLKASQADLLKNYLLSYSNERIVEAQQKWARMVGILESLDQSGADITVTYLHHLLITRTGPTRAAEVYSKVRQAVNSEGKALEFLNDLADGANDYAALFNSDHSKWNEYGTSTRKHLSTINRDLRVEQIRPLMFAVARHFSVKEAQKAFRLFVSWSVRFLVSGGRGGLLDRNYAIAAQKIGNKAIRTAAELTESLMDVIPSDAVFEVSFTEARVSQAHLARYYLRALEKERGGEGEPEWVPSEEEHAVNIEHVLPENPQANWASFDAETAGAYYRRLGNQALLQAKRNSRIGNIPFAEKKKVLGQSTFSLTAMVAECADWGPADIDGRQACLAKLAIKTWPMKL